MLLTCTTCLHEKRITNFLPYLEFQNRCVLSVKKFVEIWDSFTLTCLINVRAVASGGGAFAHPVFGRTVNPISTKGTDYAHHSTTELGTFSNKRPVRLFGTLE